ncbi:hypothetical protein A6R68_17217, partial [Neotoma lepida]
HSTRVDTLNSQDGLLGIESGALSVKLGQGLGKGSEGTNQIHTCAETAKIDLEKSTVKSFLDNWTLSSKRRQVGDQNVAKWEITCQGYKTLKRGLLADEVSWWNRLDRRNDMGLILIAWKQKFARVITFPPTVSLVRMSIGFPETLRKTATPPDCSLPAVQSLCLTTVSLWSGTSHVSNQAPIIHSVNFLLHHCRITLRVTVNQILLGDIRRRNHQS